MDVASEIRQIYEKLPYPRVKADVRRTRPWQLAPMEWITAMWQPTEPAPGRILVAGCGTGAEAFTLRQKFPDADITAADFSPRSIKIARERQSSAGRAGKIRFLVGDLTSRDFAAKVGRGFDFITCHGVLSYIPKPARALGNLAGSLAPAGALYLGVNGAAHFNVAWRRVLRALGYNVRKFDDSVHLRRLLALCDVAAGHGARRIARQDAGFLAGDLFGALNQSLPLAQWNRIARRAGLYCRGSFATLTALRGALEDNLLELLMPRGRAKVAELLDWLSPISFHWLVFTQAEPANPPWGEVDELLGWRPKRTPLYEARWPKRRPTSRPPQRLILTSKPTNALVELRVPGWELEILKRSNGSRSLRQILASIPAKPPAKTLISQLYALYQLAVLDLLAPGPGDSTPLL
jgi:SAM-dependent methyltransferase